MTPSPKQKVRKVKGWAVFTVGKLEAADAFTDNSCCCSEGTNAAAIYMKKMDLPWAVKHYPERYKVIPCVISYLQ